MPEPEFDVFLSHATPDKPVVEELARILKRRGVEPWLDSWNLVPGEPWQEAIEEALGRCAACAVFIGPSGTGPWQNEEMRAAIERQVGRPGGCRVIPVLLPSAERGERSRLPAFLVRRTWVEFHDSLEDDRILHRLVAGIRGEPPGPAPGEAVAEGACPYRGLEVFDVEDALFFHGREALTGWLLAKLRPARRDQRFLAILGPSGSGKSSLARAGLLAALKNGEIPGSQSWPRVVCKPGENPLEDLAIALTQTLRPDDSPAAVSQLAKSFETDSHTLHITARLALRNAPEGYLVLLVDQFEKVLTCQGEAQRQALIDNLLYAAREPAGQTAVVITLRSDFYGRCAAYPELAAALSDRGELVGPMTEEELRSAIEEPARLSGLELEGGLADLLMGEVKGQPGGLPLLQHALLRTWELRAGRRLTLAAYREIGGVAGALQGHAEQVFAGFTENERETCRRVLLRLVQVDDQRRVTKRQLSLDELIRGAGTEEDRKAIETVVSRFTAERLLITGGKERPTLEIAHEALLTAWKRFSEWIQDEQQDLLTRDRLEEAAREWVANGRDPSYLYAGARLSQAEDWKARHPGELSLDAQALVTDSVTRRDRQRRWTMALLSAAVLVAGVIAFTMFGLWKDSERQLRTNLAIQMAKQAELNLQPNPLISLLLGIESVRLQNDLPAAKEALLNALAVVDGRPLGKPGIVAVAASADRRTLATASREGMVTFWDLEPEIPREIRTLRVKGTIKRLALSSDRHWLLASDADDNVWLWGLKKGGPGIVLPDESWRPGDPFSPDNRWLVTQKLDTPVLRSLGSNLQKKELNGWPQIRAMAYGLDGRLQVLLEGRGATEIEVWDLNKIWNSESQVQESARAILPDSGLKNRVIRIFMGRTTNTNRIFSADGQWIGSFMEGHGTFMLQQKVTDRALIRAAFPAQEKIPDSAHMGTNFPALGQPLHGLFFVQGDRQIITQAGTEAPRLRDLRHYHYRQVLAAMPEEAGPAVRKSEKSLELVEGNGSRKLQGDSSSWTGALAFSPDGTRLAAGFREGTIFLWNLTDGHLTPRVATLEGSLRGIRRLVFDPQGRLLAIGAGSAVWLWDIESGEPKSVVRENTQRGVFLSVSDLAFGSNPPRLAIAWNDGKVLLFGLAGLRFLKDLSRPTEVTALAFSPAGKKLAIAEFDSGKAHIWSNEGAEIPLQNQNQKVRVLAFSKDERWLAGSGFDGTVQLWDLGKERASGIPLVWKGHSRTILSLAFTADGKELVTIGATDSVRRWPLDADEMIRVACARAGAGRNLTREEWNRYAPPSASYREGVPCEGVGPPRSGSVF